MTYIILFEGGAALIRTLKDINWNQVYSFYEVARRLSMKRASEVLGVSTPTLSEQVKRLEDILGVQLFRRLPRRLELTKDGQSLYHCAKEMFEAGFRFLDTVSHHSIGGYPVRIGVQESVASSVSIEFLMSYWDYYTAYGTVNTTRCLYVEDLFENLLNGRFDWALTLEPPRHKQLASVEVGVFDFSFVCSKHVYQRFRDCQDILRSIPLARNSHDEQINAVVDDYLRSQNIFPEEVIETDHQEFTLGLAQRGRCVATLARQTIERSHLRSEFALFDLGEPIPIRLFASWHAGSERMIPIRKLQELLTQESLLSGPKDPQFQLKVNEVPADLLREVDVDEP